MTNYRAWRARFANYGLTVPTHIETRLAVALMVMRLVVEAPDPWANIALLMQVRKDIEAGTDSPPRPPGRWALVRAALFFSRISARCLRRALAPGRRVTGCNGKRH